jgi:ketosteroid isomerase-like protein
MKYVILAGLFLSACISDRADLDLEKIKEVIVQTENDFANLARKEGIAFAFLEFADNEAVLQRGNELIQGKEAIRSYFERIPKRDETLEWAPDFVDVSASGDLAYTYGSYTYAMVDSTGNRIENQGVFHTVWKKQDDGSWKFVWD